MVTQSLHCIVFNSVANLGLLRIVETHVTSTYPGLFHECATFSIDRKYLFDGAHHDPNYAPLPEDRPGGFEWGPGRPTGGGARREDNVREHQD